MAGDCEFGDSVGITTKPGDAILMRIVAAERRVWSIG
jgi:hypothetical protein